MDKLTPSEFKIMTIFWEIEHGFVHDIIAQLKEEDLHYNTISSIVRLIEKKGFLTHKAYGHTYEYFVKISKNEYYSFLINQLLDHHFDGSFSRMVSFYAKQSSIDLTETERMLILRW